MDHAIFVDLNIGHFVDKHALPPEVAHQLVYVSQDSPVVGIALHDFHYQNVKVFFLGQF